MPPGSASKKRRPWVFRIRGYLMTDGQSEACAANGPDQERTPEWHAGYKAGWFEAVKWSETAQVAPLLREIQDLVEHIRFIKQGGPRAD